MNPMVPLKLISMVIPMKTGKPDGKLDDADKVIYGSADPGYLFGFNNTLR